MHKATLDNSPKNYYLAYLQGSPPGRFAIIARPDWQGHFM